MEKRIWVAALVLTMVLGIGGTADLRGQNPAAPAISASFASKTLSPGDTWKIYLNASDPQGEMRYVVAEIEQPGVGMYSASYTRIKEGNRKEFSGYVYLSTLSFAGSPNFLNFTALTLTIWVKDRSGNFSAPAIFPLSFSSRFHQEAPPSGVFQENNLGPVMIQLRTLDGGVGIARE